MNRFCATILVLSVLSGQVTLGATGLTKTDSIVWDASLTLPSTSSDSTCNIGLAGAFSGLADGKLVVAGGANFPEGLPSEGGRKAWWDDVYIYDFVSKEWSYFPGALPEKVAYGASIELPGGILCAGGCHEGVCLDGVFLLGISPNGEPVIEQWPSLPCPLANMAFGKVGSKVFLAGGISSMEDQRTQKLFLCLDTASPSEGWKELEPWPGAPRAFATGAVQSNGLDNCFYLFGGREFYGDGPWTVHTDGFEFNPRLGSWQPLEGKFPVMAGTAVPMGTNHILFAGGALEGNIRFNGLRLYHTVTGSMVEIPVQDAEIPVTSTLVKTPSGFILSSGEVAPGVRTPVILQAGVTNSIKHMGWLDILVIFLYFAILIWMGYHFSKKQQTSDDYFKGGGRIPWFIVGLSIFGTGLSAITFMSIPAKAYATDWSYLLFNAGIVLVVPLIVLVFIPLFRKFNVTTAYEYLEKRFNPLVRVICSVAFIVYQIGRMGVVLLLPAIALNVVTGFNIFLCIGMMGIFALIYTYKGGIEAVAWTDAMQVVVLLGAAVAVVCFICNSTEGGMGGVIATAAGDAKFNLGSLKFDLKQSTVWTVLIATVFTNITTYGTDQTIVQRYLTTQTREQASKGVYTNAILCIPATVLFFFVGTCLYVFFKNNPMELSTSINDADAILPWYVSLHIPAGVMGLVIAGIFAAAMSTVSASMNSAATAFVTDIFSKLPNASGKDKLRIAKFATVVLGLVGVAFAFVMATWDVKSLWDEFSKILGILLGGLGGLFLLAFVSRKANSAGALAGLAGCVAVQLIVMHNQSVYLLLYSTVGFISCFVIGWLVSVLTGGSKKDLKGLTIRKY